LNRAVFLDRDGVVNRAIVRDGKPYPPSSVRELEIVADAPKALCRLREAGLMLIVVTNQPDVARGTQKRAAVEAIHERLASELPVDDILACYHDDSAHCFCRKPNPGSLLEAAARHRIDLKKSFMVGDRWRDIEAGQRAGCTALFIDYDYSERKPEPPYLRVGSLTEAADLIIQRITMEKQ
jgi:D-glycero-D-manno-heptose 1,7-bisphosphate phosphatase